MALTSLDIDKALVIAGLNKPTKMSMVYSRDHGYNVLTQLASMMGPSISVHNPKVEVSSLGNTSVYSPVTATPSLSGTDLVIPVANTTGFRVGDIVADANGVKGRIESKTSTTITISEYTVALSSSTHFQVGHTAKVFFDASYNRNSVSKTGNKFIPETDFTYLGVTREGGSQTRRERTESWVQWNNGFWHGSWIDLILKNHGKQLEIKYAESELAAINAGLDNEYYTTQGLRSAILDKGQYFPMSSEVTLTEFNDFLATMRRVAANGGRKLVAIMGTQALARLQTIISDKYLVNVGAQNTFGGVAVQGLDIYKYQFLGMSVEFVTWSYLDDPMFAQEISTVTGVSKKSSSIYLMDMTPLPAADGSGMMNPIQKYHFNDDELIAGFRPGLVGLQGSTPSAIKEAIGQGMSGSLIVNDGDSVSFDILSDCGVYFAADRFGLIELTV